MVRSDTRHARDNTSSLWAVAARRRRRRRATITMPTSRRPHIPASRPSSQVHSDRHDHRLADNASRVVPGQRVQIERSRRLQLEAKCISTSRPHTVRFGRPSGCRVIASSHAHDRGSVRARPKEESRGTQSRAWDYIVHRLVNDREAGGEPASQRFTVTASGAMARLSERPGSQRRVRRAGSSPPRSGVRARSSHRRP